MRNVLRESAGVLSVKYHESFRDMDIARYFVQSERSHQSIGQPINRLVHQMNE